MRHLHKQQHDNSDSVKRNGATDDANNDKINDSNSRTVPDTDETSRITCGTTTGTIVMELYRAWSPHGYDRAVALFEQRFYDHSHFFRTVPNFLVQFGIGYSTDSKLQAMAKQTILDDPKFESMVFEPGMLSYAGSGPDSRTSQMFIALRHGGFGTEPWETPFGKVVEGMECVQAFFSGYGDMPPWGKGPVQGKIHSGGNQYMEDNFPKMDKFLECTVVRHPVAARRTMAVVATVAFVVVMVRVLGRVGHGRRLLLWFWQRQVCHGCFKDGQTHDSVVN